VAVFGATIVIVAGLFGYFRFHGRNYNWMRMDRVDAMLATIALKIDELSQRVDTNTHQEK